MYQNVPFYTVGSDSIGDYLGESTNVRDEEGLFSWGGGEAQHENEDGFSAAAH